MKLKKKPKMRAYELRVRRLYSLHKVLETLYWLRVIGNYVNQSARIDFVDKRAPKPSTKEEKLHE